MAGTLLCVHFFASKICTSVSKLCVQIASSSFEPFRGSQVQNHGSYGKLRYGLLVLTAHAAEHQFGRAAHIASFNEAPFTLKVNIQIHGNLHKRKTTPIPAASIPARQPAARSPQTAANTDMRAMTPDDRIAALLAPWKARKDAARALEDTARAATAALATRKSAFRASPPPLQEPTNQTPTNQTPTDQI